MISCPCCSNQMVRHIQNQKLHWFCRHCWQEMPNLNSDRCISVDFAKRIQGINRLIHAYSEF